MKMRRLAYFALTCSTITLACYSQNQPYSDTSGNSQSYPQSSDSYQSSDCADPMLAATNPNCLLQGDQTDQNLQDRQRVSRSVIKHDDRDLRVVAELLCDTHNMSAFNRTYRQICDSLRFE